MDNQDLRIRVQIVKLLATYFATDSEANTWVWTPCAQLGGQRPVDTINEGRGQAVIDLFSDSQKGVQ